MRARRPCVVFGGTSGRTRTRRGCRRALDDRQIARIRFQNVSIHYVLAVSIVVYEAIVASYSEEARTALGLLDWVGVWHNRE